MKVGVVSDLHCGSIFGLLPPNFHTSDGALRAQNAGQNYLWRCWTNLAQRWHDDPVDVLVVNGDVIDGTQRMQAGTELALPMLADQAEAAEQVLTFLLSANGTVPTYFIQGTEYHDCKAGRSVEAVAKALHAEQYHGLGTGKYSKEVLDLDIDGTIINFSHGISVSQGFYRLTAVDREGVWSALAGKEGKSPKADCVVRSHAHYFAHAEHESKHIVITPCWQLQTRYMRKNSVYRMQPSLGALEINVDPAAKRADEDPIHIEKVLYRLPEMKPVPVRVNGN